MNEYYGVYLRETCPADPADDIAYDFTGDGELVKLNRDLYDGSWNFETVNGYTLTTVRAEADTLCKDYLSYKSATDCYIPTVVTITTSPDGGFATMVDDEGNTFI